jgi:F0F1-type ATP synthase membrane subunit a
VSFFVVSFPLATAIAMMAFEIFVALIQTFIFSILAAIYIAEATHAKH